jgi:hypothetical protein
MRARLSSTIDLLGILDSATPDEICPRAIVRSARWWPWDLPGVATAGRILQVLRDGNERPSDIAVATWPRCARPCTPVTLFAIAAPPLSGMRRVVRALPAGAGVLWLDETV